MATYSFCWLNGKSWIWHFLLSYCRYMYLEFFLQKCFFSSPLWFMWIVSKLLNLIGHHGNRNGKFSKKYSKIFSSEIVREMKLKLCNHVHDISFYIEYVFYCCCRCTFLAMATKSFHRLIMGKVEIGIYFCVTGDILTNVLQKCSCSSLLQTIWILSKSLILIGCHDNWNVKFSKIFFSEVIRGIKLKLCINVCVIILYINYVFTSSCACGFFAMATLSFHRFIMGKVKIGLYFYLTSGILTKAL